MLHKILLTEKYESPRSITYYYRRLCPKKEPIRLSKCQGTKYENSIVNVQELVKKTREAMLQKGYEFGDSAGEIQVTANFDPSKLTVKEISLKSRQRSG